MRRHRHRRALRGRLGHHARRKSYKDIAADIVARRQALWTDVLEPATRAVPKDKVTRPKKPRVLKSGRAAEDARAKRILELETKRAALKDKEARFRHEQHEAEVEEQACSTRALKKITALASKAGRAKEDAAKKESQIQELLREAMR